MADHRATALYFEDRAKRARTAEERERFLAVARRYRERAESKPLSQDTSEANRDR